MSEFSDKVTKAFIDGKKANPQFEEAIKYIEKVAGMQNKPEIDLSKLKEDIKVDETKPNEIDYDER